MRDRRKEVDKLLQYLKSKIDVDIVDINNSFIFRMTTDLNIITLHCQYGSNIVFQIDFFGREITIRYLNNTTRNAYYTYEEFYYYWYDKLCEIVLVYFTYTKAIKKVCTIDSDEYVKAEVRKKKIEKLIS